ncbi:MAG: hypothetical protein RL757_1285, partial [Bacteroidota bacterium]
MLLDFLQFLLPTKAWFPKTIDEKNKYHA